MTPPTSPQVWSMCAETEKNSRLTDALPWIRHGVGPSSVTSSRTLKTPTPNAFSETEADTWTIR